MIDLSLLSDPGTSSFTPSVYQQSIFSAIENESANLIIEAVAGSGKTTTILECFARLPASETPIFLAFNKAIAEELKNRGVTASTFHSLCYSSLRKILPKPSKIDGRKVFSIVKSIISETLFEDYFELPRLVSLLKNAGHLVCPGPDPLSLIEEHELSFPDNQKAIDFALRALEISNADLSKIDFDDMLYLPALRNLPLPSHSIVFIDEAQDTNPLQLFLLNALKAKRYIFVGDTHQAIYGFRGAGTQSMQLIKRLFQCRELPLSVSYRCPSLIINEAKRIVPQIESAPDAPPGLFKSLETAPLSFCVNKTVLCRSNRPIIALAYALLKQNIQPRIIGKDLSATFKAIIKRAKAPTLPKLIEKIQAMQKSEVAAASRETAKAAIEDKFDSLLCILDNLPSNIPLPEIPKRIDELFSDGPGQVVLSSIHRAKGREFPSVILLSPSLIPSRFATLDWQIQQEYNLLYVAITRAQNSLFFIDEIS